MTNEELKTLQENLLNENYDAITPQSRIEGQLLDIIKGETPSISQSSPQSRVEAYMQCVKVNAESSGGDFVGIKYSDFDSYRGSPRVADARSLPDEISRFGGYSFLFANAGKNPNGGFHAMLETIYLPKLIYFNTSIFNSCGALKKIIGDFEDVTMIGNNAFANCGITVFDYDLPSLTKIEVFSFNGSSNLIAVTLRNNNVVTLGNVNAFTNTPIAKGTGFIYVPKALIETYKTATNWVTYANQFRALEDYTVDGTITGALDESKI